MTIKMYEQVGIAGLHIEDQSIFPLSRSSLYRELVRVNGSFAEEMRAFIGKSGRQQGRICLQNQCRLRR